MIGLVIPQLEDLWFREQLIGDEATMAYNKKWGGTIAVPRSRWEDWYARWVTTPQHKRLYRYILNEDHLFVGDDEVLYRRTSPKGERIFVVENARASSR